MSKAKKPLKVKNAELVDAQSNNNTIIVLDLYRKHCKNAGIVPDKEIEACFSTSENPNNGKQLIVTDLLTNANFHLKALSRSCLGEDPRYYSMLQTNKEQDASTNDKEQTSVLVRYSGLKEIRIWRTTIGQEGIRAIAQLFDRGGKHINITYLEMLDCGLDEVGARLLGRSFSRGMNNSIITLTLDCNPKLGNVGVSSLCEGIRTNSSILNISLARCNIESKGAKAISHVLKSKLSKLQTLDLTGNNIGGIGLAELSIGLIKNKLLTTLILAENNIASSNLDGAGLRSLAKAIALSNVKSLDISNNPIGEMSSNLLPELGVENKSLSFIKVDPSIPNNFFTALYRSRSADSKSKGKKKKKKKKK